MSAPPPESTPPSSSLVRRLVVAVFGSTVVLLGVAMLVLPGPGTVVIPAGLAILATEFLWARRLLHRLKEQGSRLVQKAKGIGKE